MFIRTKVVKGFIYYQVVRSERDGNLIRQRFVVALGRNPTVDEAIKAERRSLAGLRRERGRWPEAIDPAALGKAQAAKLARLDEGIVKAKDQIELLVSVRKAMKTDAKSRKPSDKTEGIEG